MDCKDRFEVFYTKEDIIAIRKLLFRKKFRSRVIILVGLTLYAIFLSSHLPVFWNESQSDMFILCVFLDEVVFITAIRMLRLIIKWNRQKKLEISRCRMRHTEVKIFDGCFSVSQYFGDWKSGELYIRPQDIDAIWRDSGYTVLLRESEIICTLKNTCLEDHLALKKILFERTFRDHMKI